MDEPLHNGGCCCGAVRYRVERIFDVAYCHCAQCRKRSGAPVYLSVVVPKDAFHLIQGDPVAYRSSDAGVGYFCGTCGTNLYFVEAGGSFVSVGHGTLDDPERVEPKAHRWTQSALTWFVVHDGLPRAPDGADHR
jgi:hypothetical protein